MKTWGPLAFYVALFGWWLYIASLALSYPPDAAFTFWLVAILGGLLTLLRAASFVRGRLHDRDRSSVNGPARPATATSADAATEPGTEGASARTATTTSTAVAGADEPDPTNVAAKRQARVLLSFLTIMVGMQVVGIHIVLPLFVAGYLFVFARVRKVVALLAVAVVMFLIIVLIFDYLLLTPWPSSLLEDQLDLRWGRYFSRMLP